jgi:hypothetical protein
MANFMSMGMNSLAGKLARRIGGSAIQEGTYLYRLAQHRFLGSAASILERKVAQDASRAAARRFNMITLGKLIAKGIQEYCEVVDEVVMEMAFDTMLSENSEARPLGGATVFLMSMTLSITVSTMLQSMGHKGLKTVDGTVTPKIARNWAGAARASLLGVSFSLAVAQTIMRIPVLMANAA